MRKAIVNLCPTGMVPTKEMNPHVPISPKEIGKAVAQCSHIASIVHIHPRDEDGRPTWKPDVFKHIVDEIKTQSPEEVLICATTSGRLYGAFDKRSALLDLKGDYKPDLASLTLGSNNFARTASQNSPGMIRDLAKKMQDNGIKPELEVFEPGMVWTARHLMQKGILSDKKPYFNILLDSPGTSPLNPSSFAAFHALLSEDAEWSVAGIGSRQLNANAIGLAFGGHVRIGLEDNLYLHRGDKKLCADNHILVHKVSVLMHTLNIGVANDRDAREMLGI